MIRRLVEGVFALWLLLIVLPFLPLVAILIKLDSDGPVFFYQERVGWQGKPYTLYKLRSTTVPPVPEQRRGHSRGQVDSPLKNR